MLPKPPHRLLHAAPELPPRLRVAVHPPVVADFEAEGGKRRVREEGIAAVIDHVLKHDHAETVAGIVKQLRLDLDVLAQGVEAQPLHGKNVVLKAGGRRGRKQAVAPVPLVENAVEEIGFPVQAQARLAVFRPDLQRAQGEIGLHAVLRRLDLRLVKIGILRRPEAGRLQRQRRAAPLEGLLQHALRRPDAHDALLHALRKQADAVSLRFSADRADILLRHALQPDGLPQAGYRRIPHSAAPASLLAVGQNVGLQPVGHADEQDVFLPQGVRNVEGEGLIAAGMRAERRTVQPDLRDLIRRAEVQQHAPPHKARGQEEAAPVVQRPVPG